MEKVYYEDYEIGEILESPGRTITETDIVMFAALTGDWHPIHTNAEFAGKTIFGERIAHGMLGLTIGSALIFRLGPHVFTPRAFIAFYGIDRIRFTGPIKIGDTITCVARVAAMKERDASSGVVSYDAAIRNQRGEDCVVFTPTILSGRKP